MSRLRVRVAAEMEFERTGYEFTWIVDFPMFGWDALGQRIAAVHHPFTSAWEEEWDRLGDEPLTIRSRAYDLVLNGTELGGGSIRIHRRAQQEAVFRVLGLTEDKWLEKFGFLLEALSYGTPPHGGIAFGLDRMVMLLAGAGSIRETIAFPKTQRGQDLVMDAPGAVDPEQLLDLHLKLVQVEEDQDN